MMPRLIFTIGTALTGSAAATDFTKGNFVASGIFAALCIFNVVMLLTDGRQK